MVGSVGGWCTVSRAPEAGGVAPRCFCFGGRRWVACVAPWTGGDGCACRAFVRRDDALSLALARSRSLSLVLARSRAHARDGSLGGAGVGLALLWRAWRHERFPSIPLCADESE